MWLLERVVPGPLALALWGLLAAGIALWLGVLELTPKTHHQKLAQLIGLPLLVYALVAWVGALQGESDPLRPLGQAQVGAAVAAPSAQQSEWQTVTTPAELDAALAEAKSRRPAAAAGLVRRLVHQLQGDRARSAHRAGR